MVDPVIRVEHLSKKFCRSLKQGMLYTAADVLRDTVGFPARFASLRPGEFWALDDVSFTLMPGQCLGLIGDNGAGRR